MSKKIFVRMLPMASTSDSPSDWVYRDYYEDEVTGPDDNELYTCTYCGTVQKLSDALDIEHRTRPGCVSCGAPVILIGDD